MVIVVGCLTPNFRAVCQHYTGVQGPEGGGAHVVAAVRHRACAVAYPQIRDAAVICRVHSEHVHVRANGSEQALSRAGSSPRQARSLQQVR